MNISLRLNRESLRKGMMGLVNVIAKEEIAEVRKASNKLQQAQPEKGKNEYLKAKSESRTKRMRG